MDLKVVPKYEKQKLKLERCFFLQNSENKIYNLNF